MVKKLWLKGSQSFSLSVFQSSRFQDFKISSSDAPQIVAKVSATFFRFYVTNKQNL